MTIAAEWAGQTSVDRRATVLLRHEHALLLDLFRRQRVPGEAVDGEWLQQRIMDLVELMGRMEHDVLFPALPAHYAPLVGAFEAEHAAVAGCVDGLRRAPDAPATKAQGERLELLVRAHLAHEEMLLFQAVERDEPELDASLYEALVAARRRMAEVAGQAGTSRPH